MISPLLILKLALTTLIQIPVTAIRHILGLSPETQKWTLSTALVIKTMYSISTSFKASITQQQNLGLGDPGVKGPLWVAKTRIARPAEDAVRQALFQATDALKSDAAQTYVKPDLCDVEAEWVGHRAGADGKATLPLGQSEAERYAALQKDAQTETVILYFHGGAYYMLDPVSVRSPLARLCKLSGARALSVRYRLAPQHPFPAGVLDCFLAYLDLMYPGEQSLHQAAIPAKRIVFAGESAGGGIAVVLVQLILQLHRMGTTEIRFRGRDVSVPLPAGIATVSAYTNATLSFPSTIRNAWYDYLPVPETATGLAMREAHHRRPLPITIFDFPECGIWPAVPARADIYCDGETMLHPLVSPAVLPAESWQGSPPMYFNQGQEVLADDGRVVAQQAWRAGVSVQFEAWEAMPHCFPLALNWTREAGHATLQWAGAIRDMGSGSNLETRAVEYLANGSARDLNWQALSGMSDATVLRYMRDEQRRRCEMLASRAS